MTSLAGIAKSAYVSILQLSAGLALLGTIAAPVAAQPVQSQGGVDSDLARPDGSHTPVAEPTPVTTAPSDDRYPSGAPQSYAGPPAPYAGAQAPYSGASAPYAGASPMASGPATSLCGRQTASGGVYQPDDLIGAAEGVFGSGARGLAALIRDILSKQGAPDGYIAGREAGGAFAIGLRYGSGILCQKIDGPQPVYWTGPSIGFDAGANAAKTFVLVYNLNNRDDLFRRFGAGEGQAYLVGGFNVSYLRRGNVVLIPVRMGIGLRLGINGGYMKFSHRQNWLPF